MPKAIHCLCHNNVNQAPICFRRIDQNTYKSGYWIVQDHALIKALKENGWLYLQDSSRFNSWFVGVVLNAEQRDADGRWDFTVQKREINPKPWRGAIPRQWNAASHVQIVDCTWRFELPYGRPLPSFLPSFPHLIRRIIREPKRTG